MPVNLSIKNVPDDVVRGLRNRAARNQRSLQQEVLAVLKQAVAADQGEISIDEMLERAQRQKPALDDTVSRVSATRDAERESMARRFEDLAATSDD